MLRPDEVLDTLANEQMTIAARLPRASNATYLARVGDGETKIAVVYKPRRGERPLWDFDAGTLCMREVASFVVSQSLGWGLVPPTVLRDGPLGEGSVQLFIAADAQVDVIDLVERGDASLMPLAVLDVMLNSADRKIGHCLLDQQRRLWGIDNGLTFHVEPKLRTVLWAWMGLEVPAQIVDDIRHLRQALDDEASRVRTALDDLLDTTELLALCDRVDGLIRNPCFPEPDPYGPAVPWPPY